MIGAGGNVCAQGDGYETNIVTHMELMLRTGKAK